MSLEDELSCPVCTELFSHPVLLGCGHSFCRQCINDHWTSSKTRNCPVCRQVSPQEPLSNLCLRNTCESYLREKNKKENKDEEHECPIHGEKIALFCQTDEQTICATCMDYEHRWHKTQPLEQAVRQRKSQAQRTERKIREEFNKLQQFLKKEEESRIVALNEEEKEKRGKMKRKMRSLSDRLREVEERMKDDDVSFLQNYNSIMNRAKKTLPDSELCPEALIDVQKHLGNLKYQVWEKMKDICPYYPVILDPNAAPPDVFISNDLTSVTSCVHRQDEHNPLPLHSNHLVLGTVGYSSGGQTWDIEVGNSRHWSLGVCLGSEERSIVQMLNPADGFWGLRRDGDVYRFLKISATFKLNTNPQVVRVTLGDCYDKKGVWWRNVIFSDATCNSPFAYFHLPAGMELFPFVIPEKRSGPLRIVPAKVTVTIEQVEEERSLPERHRDSPKVRWNVLFLALFFLLVVVCVFVMYHLIY